MTDPEALEENAHTPRLTARRTRLLYSPFWLRVIIIAWLVIGGAYIIIDGIMDREADGLFGIVPLGFAVWMITKIRA